MGRLPRANLSLADTFSSSCHYHVYDGREVQIFWLARGEESRFLLLLLKVKTSVSQSDSFKSAVDF